ncbi:hypothetical protein ACH5RR_008988 [Cinchona calisaya]|uniref:At1g61320/AtMIF1 LRR domain-containing protein n=1 Tax=Cinchona calisaya TaxID=153742 RepID=A0ABD3ACW3_9GENT
MLERQRKGKQLNSTVVGGHAHFCLGGVCKEYKKGEQLHKYLMGDHLSVRGVSKKHKDGGQLHPNLMASQAKFSLKERNDVAAKDLTSELPGEILCYILSLLPLREAARTSILGRNWRCLWRSSLNLNFDFMNMSGKNEPFHGKREADLVKKRERRFVAWVDRLLELHDGSKIKSCKIDYPLHTWYHANVDHWIQKIAAQGVEKLHIKVAHYTKCYEFPCRLLTRVETLSFLRHLTLDYCRFNLPHDFSCLGNLISLSFANSHLTQDNIDSIFNCTKLESFSMKACLFPHIRMKIASKCDHLKLKHLSITFCYNPEEVEIYTAISLSSLECLRGQLRRIWFRDSVKLLKLCFVSFEEEGAYTFSQSGTFPQLQTLSLGLNVEKGFEISKSFPTFPKLRELVLFMEYIYPGSMLDFIISFLKASPLLHKLDLHLHLLLLILISLYI